MVQKIVHLLIVWVHRIPTVGMVMCSKIFLTGMNKKLVGLGIVMQCAFVIKISGKQWACLDVELLKQSSGAGARARATLSDSFLKLHIQKFCKLWASETLKIMS